MANPTREVDNDDDRQTSYDIVPLSDAAITADERLDKVQTWLETLERPVEMTEKEYNTFMRYCTEFFILGT